MLYRSFAVESQAAVSLNLRLFEAKKLRNVSIIDNVSGGRMCTVQADRLGPSPITRSEVVP